MSADVLYGLIGKVNTLLSRLTDTRATHLDLLPTIDSNAKRARTGPFTSMAIPTVANNKSIVANTNLLENLPNAKTLVSLTQSADYTTVYSLSGPGVLSFLGIQYTGTYVMTGNITLTLTIDGNAVATDHTWQTATENETLMILGAIDETGGNFQPMFFETEVKIEMKHAEAGQTLGMTVHDRFTGMT